MAAGLVLSLLMLAGIALTVGAVLAWRRADRQRGVLMALAAATMFANVAIWAVPGAGGSAPVERTLQQQPPRAT